MSNSDHLEYRKAISVFDTTSIVYAKQFTEDEYDFEDVPEFGVGKKVYLIRSGDELDAIAPNEWQIWFPDKVVYDFISDEDFRAKYVLYDDLPPKLKEIADKFPSYEEWAEQVNQHCREDWDKLFESIKSGDL